MPFPLVSDRIPLLFMQKTLISLENVSCIHFILHIIQHLIIAVCNDEMTTVAPFALIRFIIVYLS